MISLTLANPVATIARPLPASEMLGATRPDDGGLTRADVIGAAMGGGVASLAGGYTGLSALPHEAGHAVAAELLFRNANPSIELLPGKGGVTRWSPDGGLSELGERYGYNGSRAIVSGAGVLVDTAISMAMFGAGYAMRKKHPIIGRTMMGYAGMTMLNDVLYAATALGSAVSKGNDFASLATFAGIHPVVAMAALAAVLPAEYLLLRAIEKARQ